VNPHCLACGLQQVKSSAPRSSLDRLWHPLCAARGWWVPLRFGVHKRSCASCLLQCFPLPCCAIVVVAPSCRAVHGYAAVALARRALPCRRSKTETHPEQWTCSSRNQLNQSGNQIQRICQTPGQVRLRRLPAEDRAEGGQMSAGVLWPTTNVTTYDAVRCLRSRLQDVWRRDAAAAHYHAALAETCARNALACASSSLQRLGGRLIQGDTSDVTKRGAAR
jgi:hypothetical protein